MVELTTRDFGPNPKGAALTNEEVDSNFLNLNEGLDQVQQEASDVALVMSIALG